MNESVKDDVNRRRCVNATGASVKAASRLAADGLLHVLIDGILVSQLITTNKDRLYYCHKQSIFDSLHLRWLAQVDASLTISLNVSSQILV